MPTSRTQLDSLVAAGELFAPWVDWQTEHCRNGRTLITAVNQRDGQAIYLDSGDLNPASPGYNSAFAELHHGGFLAGATGAQPDSTMGIGTGGGIVWRGADRFVRHLHDAGLRRAFQPGWVAVQALLALAGAVAFVLVARTGNVDLHARPAQIPAIIGLGLVAVFIHETGHALVTVHYGRQVRMAGLRLHLGSPAFYVESLDALLLTRRQRLLQAAAGPWAEWMATSVAALAYLTIGHDTATAAILHRFVIVNVIVLASNLLPFVGLDGALLFSDIIHEPDLPFRASRPGWDRPTGDRLLSTYSAFNAAVAAGLLVMAGFFWWQLFAGLIHRLWAAGPIGVAALAAGGVALARQVAVTVTGAVAPIAAHARRVAAKIVFRTQRRWRVRSIIALRACPHIAELDEAALGILAGRLERVEVTDDTCPVEQALVVIRRSPRGGRGNNQRSLPPRGAVHVWQASTDRARFHGSELVALAPDWQRYLH